MSGPGALALTGVALILPAMVAALIADDSCQRGSRAALVGLVLLAAMVACWIGAAWWEALS